jgi:hypothetical protein
VSVPSPPPLWLDEDVELVLPLVLVAVPLDDPVWDVLAVADPTSLLPALVPADVVDPALPVPPDDEAIAVPAVDVTLACAVSLAVVWLDGGAPASLVWPHPAAEVNAATTHPNETRGIRGVCTTGSFRSRVRYSIKFDMGRMGPLTDRCGSAGRRPLRRRR